MFGIQGQECVELITNVHRINLARILGLIFNERA